MKSLIILCFRIVLTLAALICSIIAGKKKNISKQTKMKLILVSLVLVNAGYILALIETKI